MSRRRGRKGLHVGPGERYALLPREVAESSAYNAQTDWSRTVLYAVLVQYHGHNNGQLGLTYAQAKDLGVSSQWKLYAGLRLLCDGDLLVCARRGHLEKGDRLPSLYGVTWKGIDEPKNGVVYDFGINVSPIPSNAWAKWKAPGDWDEHVKRVQRRSKGRAESDSPRGVTFTTHVGSESSESRSPRGVKETSIPATHVVVASKTSAGRPRTPGLVGVPDHAIADLVGAHHLHDGDIEHACLPTTIRAAAVHAQQEGRKKP